MPSASPLTGRCYCGSSTLCMSKRPAHVAACHCPDCRRITGAPMAAFAAFVTDQVKITPDPGPGFEVTPGVRRWFCQKCGSPLAATYHYLPNQIYVPVGILDFADILVPDLQCYSSQMLPWLETLGSIPRHDKSARDRLCFDKGSA